ncbi:MAG: FAD-binding oxidoreductase [Candidatus Omnitrophica bacterium]|nr:FAD-binding oxidoreductase [Candidatus Omnitrophota bacterium]
MKAALEAWQQALGAEHVLNDTDSLQSYGRATIPISRRISAVLRPESTEQVSSIVRIASEHRVSLYPISVGRNWGYGSANPVAEDNVIVDLSRMQGIELNGELAYAVIEPGVTQESLYRYLKDRGAQLWIDPTGAGPQVSVLGNALERGYGITPYGDHFAQIAGMEIVLPDGQVLHTGFGHWENAVATRVFPRGIGPYLDGLFTQSNLGIVTRIGVWLMPVPEHFELCLFSTDKDENLDGLVNSARCLLLQGVLRSSLNLMHRNRILTMVSQYPWDLMQGQTPLSEEVAQKLADQKRIGIWNGVTAVYGTRRQVRAAKAVIRHELKGQTNRLVFISQKKLEFLERFPGPLSWITGLNIPEVIEAVRPGFGVLSGNPTESSLAVCYWRTPKKPSGASIDPARDACGLNWFAPVIPMTSAHVREFRSIVEPIFEKHGLECCITLTSVTARAFDCTLPILFDPQRQGDPERAEACNRELLEACAACGYIPYRVGVQSMSWLKERSSVYWDFVARLKQCVDPAGILAPGRYGG